MMNCMFIKNDECSIKNDEFSIENDDLMQPRRKLKTFRGGKLRLTGAISESDLL